MNRNSSRGEGVHEPLVAAWFGLAVLALAGALAAVDRQILVLITEPLKTSLRVSDTQIGLLNGVALFLTSAIATYPMGVLADRFDRRRLLAVFVIVWSVATALCSCVRNFPQLFAGGMGIAVGEAVLGPITYSMIADLFPRRHWMVANYIFYISSVLGGAAGLALSGLAIGASDVVRVSVPAFSTWDSWRISLLIAGAPGLFLAAAILLIPRARGSAAVAAPVAARSPMSAYIRRHLRALLGVFLGFGFAAGANVTLNTWVAVALVRVFHEAPATVGLRLGAVGAAASLLGVLLSGMLARLARPRLGERALPMIAQGVFLAASLAMPLYVLAQTALQVYALVFLTSVPMIAGISLSPTFLQRMAPNRFRSRVIALGGLFYVGFLALSPVAVGWLSDTPFGKDHGLLAATVLVSLPSALAGVACLWLAHATLDRMLAAARSLDDETSGEPA